MRKAAFICVFLVFCPYFGFAQTQYCDKVAYTAKNWDNLQDLRRSNPQTDNYDIIYHRLALHATVRKLWLTGKVTSYFKFTKPSTTISFDLRSHLKVDSVKMGIIKLTFNQTAEYLNISLYRPFNLGEIDSLEIFYQGNPSLGKYRSYFIETHATGKVLASQSEPYGAPDWWPCKQDLKDKFDSCDMIITTDTGYLAGGPGILVSTIIDDTLVSYHWKHRYPSNFYLLALAISNYTVITDTAFVRGVNIPIVNYVYRHLEDYARPLVKNTIPLMRVFDSLFGTYPYINEKYGHMQWNRGGGMEHATMSSMGNFSFDLVSHELAHQWFGNKITCANWQDIWINESFATFLNAISYELIYGKDSFYAHLATVLNNSKKDNERSVFVDDTTDVGRIFYQLTSYQKGAMVLQTLRVYMGDDAFYRACRNFLTDPQTQWASATTADMLRIFEKETDKKLAPFLQSHYYGNGYPTYLVRWKQYENKLKLEIAQTTSNRSGLFFPQTILLSIKTDTGFYTMPIDIESLSTKIEIPFNRKIENVYFNKNNQILASGTVAPLEESHLDRLDVFPNPSGGNFLIRSNKMPLTSVYIYDSQGKKVLDFSGLNQYELAVDLTSYNNGNYFLKIELENELYVKRYVKL